MKLRLTIAAVLTLAVLQTPAKAESPAAPAAHPTPQTVLPWAGRLHVQGWRYLGFNDHEVLFATDGSNKLSAPYLRFWMRSERFGDGEGTTGRSSKRLVQVDCHDFRWEVLDTRVYAENDLKGALLASGQTAPWQDIVDPDVMEAMMTVCLGHG